MTIIAGVFGRKPSAQVPTSFCVSLKKIISRSPIDKPIEFRAESAFILKVDIGAFGQPAHYHCQSGSFSVLAGEPLLIGQGLETLERDAQLEYLHSKWQQDDFECLRKASGTFCAAYYDPIEGTAHLIADRLGLRPLYYTIVGDFIFFASALRILEALTEVPKKMDVLSVTEMTGFGYPFGGGTPYAGIKMLQPCEVVTVKRSGDLKSTQYFRWDSIATSPESEEELLEEAHRRFMSAVQRRLRGDKTTFANLSGGLDSRCTVAALHSMGVTGIHTFNFSLPNTQDQIFAREFAKKIGTIHHEAITQPEPDWSKLLSDAWRISSRRQDRMPERPMLSWNGEGGSVGLGYVYITPEIVRKMRSGDFSGAIETFLNQQKRVIVTRVLKPQFAIQFNGYLRSKLRREVEAINHPDQLRALCIFLNLNGPRRHLEDHFDSLDLNRIEIQMPFNDSDFLEIITAIPVDLCLYHRFYNKWLSKLDPAVLAVPWQAYPGHIPSPLPIPGDLLDQWKSPAFASHKKALKQALLKRAETMLADQQFPDSILSKGNLRLMQWLMKLEVRNYGYALKAALLYYDYWIRAQGRCEFPGHEPRPSN